MTLPRWFYFLLVCLGVLGNANPVLANNFLPPEEAFQFDVNVQDPACRVNCLIDVRAKVAAGYYLYRERFDLQPVSGFSSLEFVDLPNGERKFDEFLNAQIEALRGEMVFQIRYSLVDDMAAEISAALISQGCADAGLCYPPMSTPLVFTESTLFQNALKNKGVQSFFSKPNEQTPIAAVSVDEADDLASRLADQSFWVVLPLFFGLGLLLAFTPCTLPMLPIVSSLVVGQQAGANVAARSRPVALALVYVLGMAFTYAALGVLAGLTGESLVMAMQQPLVLWAFGSVLGLLGLALLLGYSLQLPVSFQSWLQNKTGSLKGGQFLPVLLMGILSALLLGPCVAPPLAGALLYIGQTGDAVLGGAALFLLALGMGLPLVLFAAGAGATLPKAGAWMSWVSTLFGFVLLAVAIWTITPVTPVWVVMAVWALWACCAAASLFYGASNMPTMRAWCKVLSMALGLLFSMLALVYMLGLFSGGKSLLQPLSGFGAGAQVDAAKHKGLSFEKISSAEAFGLLQSSSQPVMLDFYADWCVSCKEFELFTLSDSVVQAGLTGVRLVQVDVTANTDADQALLKSFDLFGPPAILFFKAGETAMVHRVIGFQNAEKFASTLTLVRPMIGLR